MSAYETTGHAPQRMRSTGKRLVIVTTIGSGFAAAWGFTVWREGCCEHGRCHWNWSVDQAKRQAEEWLARHPEED
jgi:ABC-type sugar transport system substrate-binding protein